MVQEKDTSGEDRRRAAERMREYRARLTSAERAEKRRAHDAAYRERNREKRRAADRARRAKRAA